MSTRLDAEAAGQKEYKKALVSAIDQIFDVIMGKQQSVRISGVIDTENSANSSVKVEST